MKIAVIGGSGLIGTEVVRKLTKLGHEALAAPPSTAATMLGTKPKTPFQIGRHLVCAFEAGSRRTQRW